MTNTLPTPDWATQRCIALGGLNRFSEPNFRVVWGGSRTHKVGAIFKDVIAGKAFEVPDVRELLKYHPQRWHLERWLDPSKYGTEEEWYRTTRLTREFINEHNQLVEEEVIPVIHTCGDYPSRGDYEHVFFLAECTHLFKDEADFLAQHPLPKRNSFLEFGDYTKAVIEWQDTRSKSGIGEWCKPCQVTCGSFIPLEENFFLFEMQIRALLASDGVSETQERLAKFEEQFRKRQESRDRAESIVRNRMMEFGTIPHSYVTDSSRQCSVPDARFNPRLYNPLGRSSFRQSNRALPARKQSELEKN